MDEQQNKSHKGRVSGNKQVRKELTRKKKAGIELQPNRGNNPKAFMGRSAGSHKTKASLRSFEKRESQLRVPHEEKTFASVYREPPLLVAVVGPPNSGKTTLIRSMCKFYANRNIRDINGPITVVAGRSRRVTFLECPNTLSAMCDVAKVADLILLVVDGSYGFEMETFEFLSIAQVHGFPKVIGIVSHLDQLKTTKNLKKRKKALRHRFWHEVVDGAKMVFLAPMHHGTYRSSDVLKLHRLLITAKTQTQAWRNTHSCILVDRHEDITDAKTAEQDPAGNKTVAFYGYVRGHPVKRDQLVHIPGMGDFVVRHLSHQEDPCQPVENDNAKSQGSKLRHLSAKHKRLYAPYCDAGAISFDDDSIYLTEDAARANIERSGKGLQMMRELQRTDAMDIKMQTQDFSISGQHAAPQERRPMFGGNVDDDESGALRDRKVLVKRFDDDEDEDGAEEDDDDDYEQQVGEAGSSRIIFPENAISDAQPGQEDAKYGSDLSDYGNDESEDDDGANNNDGGADSNELAPRHPQHADATRINNARENWDDVALCKRLKLFFVTSASAGPSAANAAKRDRRDGEEEQEEGRDGEGDEDAASSRGYESIDEDELLDEEARRNGKSLAALGGSSGDGKKKGKRGRQQAQNSESGEDDEDDELDDEDDDDEDDFSDDIEDDDGGELAEGDDGTVRDDEMQGLMDHFLSGAARPQKAGGSGASRRQTVQEEVDELREDAFDDDDADDRKVNDEKAGRAKLSGGAGDADGDAEGGAEGEEEDDYALKKMAKKRAFDDAYDTGDVNAAGKNRTMAHAYHLQDEVDERKRQLDQAVNMLGDDLEKKIALVGYFSGLYVRIVLEEVPVEFVTNFDPKTPVIMGGLNAGEDQLGNVLVRVKRHRWYPKILKAMDPQVISMGWRRIQAQPIFATEDPNGRHRYLKYTPQHMHCLASFYGPTTPPNTGFAVIPAVEQPLQRNNRAGSQFRVIATGYSMAMDGISGGQMQSSANSIVKKLKLTGVPQMVQKTTVFVKGMFNSDIEAAKFVGAKVKAVSGLRGMIKKVIKGKNGIVRCTFEDKLLMSDIVFVRAWKTVEPPKYCINVPSLLIKQWRGMRTMRELRRDKNVPIESKPDSEYREVTKRKAVDPNEELKVTTSRNLRLSLPFEMKEEFVPFVQSTAVREKVLSSTTVAPEPKDVQRQALLNAMRDKAQVMDQQRRETRRVAKAKQSREHEKQMEKYAQGLKKAKKETARKSEFRSQHKSRK